MKKILTDMILQIFPVTIGVFLGFIVSDWADQNKRQAQSNLLVHNLLLEIETNQKKLESVIDYHVMLRDSSRYYTQPGIRMKKPEFFAGTRIVKLTNSAYLTGIQTGIINELRIDEIQALNDLYTFQNDYNEFGNLMMAGLINKEFTYKEEDMKKIASFLSVTITDVVIKETDLIEGYKKVKAQLTAR